MSWEEQEFPFPTPLRMSGPETTMMANNTQCICMMVTLSVVTDIELVGRRRSESINNASSVVQESLCTLSKMQAVDEKRPSKYHSMYM